MHLTFPFCLALVASAATIAACGGGSDTIVAVAVPKEVRLQDSRTDFAVIAAGAAVSTFAAMSQQATDAVDVTTFSRWVGVLGTSGYRVEVPANWNGRLVMCAHGFAGNGNMLSVSSPSIRRYLI